MQVKSELWVNEISKLSFDSSPFIAVGLNGVDKILVEQVTGAAGYATWFSVWNEDNRLICMVNGAYVRQVDFAADDTGDAR